ncbi:MAG: hypothetical protein ACYCW6_25790, partial [Candidatus Xenobia bacterium]
GGASWHEDITFVDAPTSPQVSIQGTLDGAPTGVSSMLDRSDSDHATLLATGSIAGTLVSASGSETEALPSGPPPPPPDPDPPPPDSV